MVVVVVGVVVVGVVVVLVADVVVAPPSAPYYIHYSFRYWYGCLIMGNVFPYSCLST